MGRLERFLVGFFKGADRFLSRLGHWARRNPRTAVVASVAIIAIVAPTVLYWAAGRLFEAANHIAGPFLMLALIVLAFTAIWRAIIPKGGKK